MGDFHKRKTLFFEKASPLPHSFPNQIGPYCIERLLSRGGMGALYLGENKQGGRAAIKILLPKLEKNKQALAHFLDEAAALKEARHPNIASLFETNSWERGFYIAMEFIDGVSLDRFVSKKALPEKEALRIAVQIAYALSHLHSKGIVHMDLKPENILIGKSGEVKLIDFGISACSEKPRRKKMGTPVYMSPEQKAGKKSFSCDIYSLAIVVEEMLLGRFHSSKTVRPAIQEVLKRAKDSEKRMSASDFAIAISEILSDS